MPYIQRYSVLNYQCIAKRAERDHIIREQWVKAMELRIVQEQLSKCQKSEGVNHYENCKEWSERYLNLLEDSKVGGLWVRTILFN